jgi:hypothetical protein
MDGTPGAGEPDVLLAGRYEVGPVVGLGATAEVHRAWDRERGCPVAVKIFLPGSATPGRGGAWEREVLTGIRHPGLVAVHDCGVDERGYPFVVMDLVEGDSLTARLSEGPLPAAAVTRLGAVVADALALVHAGGVVHRDVKPSNILLEADDRPRLTDFGIARMLDATRMTATGLVVGTAAYMAPEQVRGEAVGPPADVYALGLVLLEAATGRREYEGGPLESALARLHRRPGVPAGVPNPLAATVRRMTAPLPADRPTAAQVKAALTGPPVAVPRVARRRLAPAGALACLVAAVLGGALALTATDRPPEPGVVVARAAPPVLAAAPPPAAPPVPPADPGVARIEAPHLVPTAHPVPAALRAEPAAGGGRSEATRVRSRGDGEGDDDGQGDAGGGEKKKAATGRGAHESERSSRSDDRSASKSKADKGGSKGDKGGGGGSKNGKGGKKGKGDD